MALMRRWFRGWLSFAVAGLATAILGFSQASGDDFRIESKVYIKQKAKPLPAKPIAENVTLFHANRVYDFASAPIEIMVFDPTRSRFLILDPTRNLKTEVGLDEVEAFSVKLRAQAKASDNPFLSFLSEPKFEETFDQPAGLMTLTSPWMVYELTTLDAPTNEIVSQYTEFSDWFAKMGAMVTPGKIPPFARMVVTSTLTTHKQVPRDVTLTLHLQEPVILRSEHKVHWKLLEPDLQKIRQVDDYLVKFKPVTFPKYCHGEETQAKKP